MQFIYTIVEFEAFHGKAIPNFSLLVVDRNTRYNVHLKLEHFIVCKCFIKRKNCKQILILAKYIQSIYRKVLLSTIYFEMHQKNEMN